MNEVLVLNDQLVFPNGVQIALDHQSVIVGETTYAVVIRH